MKSLYLVDGYNFLHAVLLQGRERARWWSPENRERVVTAVEKLMAAGELGVAAQSLDTEQAPGLGATGSPRLDTERSPGRDATASPRLDGRRAADVWIVFDQREPDQASATAVGAPAPELRGDLQIHGAPDADEYIVARCAELAGLRQVVVVSADRSLRDRAKNHGASGLSPWAFASYAAVAGATRHSPGAG